MDEKHMQLVVTCKLGLHGAPKLGRWPPSVTEVSDISQGSVATCLTCVGIVDDNSITILLTSLTVKDVWKLVIICPLGRAHTSATPH